MAFAAGNMTRRVRILNPSETIDARGSSRLEFARDGSPVWAQIEPARAEELEAGEAFEAAVTHRITIYHTSRVTHRTRLEETLEGRVFEIVGIINVGERDRWLELRCVELAA